ncbi:hypothetical protein QYS48_30195 [Marivirga arenosa]|uniref:Lipoprotein n=1 Tax=Marivirga arenosa TaxID=3059076 RepID=A0AA51NB58_9BACT|nr:hypothetical protein [Marivirga sp. ABR2-2]WMN07875.1 hypothetical protein QYS48_30195 [Marivirga sp. ABR2-2]
MKKFTTILLISIILVSCSRPNDKKENETPEEKKQTVSEAVTNKDEYGCEILGKTNDKQINGIEIAYFLNRSDIDTTSKAYYTGSHELYDDEKTFEIMDSLDTKNANTRPFYFYNMYKMVGETDGALTEIIGNYIADYARKYPREFICYLQRQPYSGRRDEFLSLMGWNLYTKEMKDSFKKDAFKNCNDCNEKTMRKLKEYIKVVYDFKG